MMKLSYKSKEDAEGFSSASFFVHLTISSLQ